MPWSYSIDVGCDAIIATGSGVLKGEELMKGLAELTGDPRFRGDMRYLIDYRAVTEIRVPASTMLEAAGHPAFSSKMRRAFVVNSAFFQAALNFAKAAAVGPFEVFTERAPALAWLNTGVPPEKWLK